MPPLARHSGTSSARTRARLGISRAELGDLLGVGAGQVGHVEAVRRHYSDRARHRLNRLEALLRHLPPAEAGAGAAPAPTAEPAAGWPVIPRPHIRPDEVDGLRTRLRDVRYEAWQLRYQQAVWHQKTIALAHRRRALAAFELLLAADHAADPHPEPGADPGVDHDRELFWLEVLTLGTKKLALRHPSDLAQAQLRLRLRLLGEETATLEAWLEVEKPDKS